MEAFVSVLVLTSTAACIPWPLPRPSSAKALAARANTAIPTPLSLTPSQYWDGDDGLWSTFEFEVGTPPQQVRLLPGTSTSTMYFIDPQGCSASAGDSSNCTQARGFTFNPNASSTWAAAGVFQYQGSYSQTSLLGYDPSSEMGTDTVTLGWPGAPNAPTLENQFIGGLIEKEIFYVGNFGIYPRPVNTTAISNNKNSTMQTLRNQNAIPSTSWAYTAGYHAAQVPTFGSLTLGGYDTTRFRPPPNGLNIPFGPDQTRDLLVPIQSITSPSYNLAGGLLPDPINAYIDSTVPTIWLPVEACQAFEKAFNLTWDEQSEYYLLTDQEHEALRASNPSVTFTIGATLAGGSTVDVTLPYAAFDLQLVSPIASTPTNYFPLQRAANNSQYVLGRTFLQQAYVIADYDRQNFTVAQALMPQQNVQPNIVPIYPPGGSPAELGRQNAGQMSQSNSSGISGGAIAGIVIGIVAVLLIIGLLLWYIRRQKKKRAEAEAREAEAKAASTAAGASPMGETRPSLSHHPSSIPPQYEYAKAELHADASPFRDTPDPMGRAKVGTTELPGDDSRVELAEPDERARRHELDSDQTIAEMEGAENAKKATKRSGPVYEMPG